MSDSSAPAEQNYHVGEQELLAVIHALELWRCYLDNQIFVVVTDHSPNTFFIAPAAAQHTCTDMSDSSALAAVPAVSDRAAVDVAAENAEAATADADMLSQLIQGYSADRWFAFCTQHSCA